MTQSDTYIYSVIDALSRTRTYREASNIAYALAWYINSGRASGVWIRQICTIKPYLIARQLAKGGSIDAQVERVKTYVAAHHTYCI